MDLTKIIENKCSYDLTHGAHKLRDSFLIEVGLERKRGILYQVENITEADLETLYMVTDALHNRSGKVSRSDLVKAISLTILEYEKRNSEVLTILGHRDDGSYQLYTNLTTE